MKNLTSRYEKYLHISTYSYANDKKYKFRCKESWLVSTLNRKRRPFSHRVHTICRPYEKTGRPVRRLRIPCGLLKQLSSLLLSSLLFHGRAIFDGDEARTRSQESNGCLSPVPRPDNYLSLFLSFFFSSSLIKNRCDSELSKRAKGQSAARRSLICHYHDRLNPFLVRVHDTCRQSI